MATSFNKTYTIEIKYSRDDGADVTDADVNMEVIRARIKKAIGNVVPRSQGIISAHIVGTVTEA